MGTTKATGTIEIIKRGDNVVLPVTSSHAVLINETDPGNTLAAKLGEIDNSLNKKQDKLTTSDDLLIYLPANSADYVIQHNNSLGAEVGEETLLLIFDIDNHGHITNCRNATPEDLAKTGTAFLRFVGNYNPKITYSYGDICVINGDVPSDMSLEEGDFIIMGTTGKWSSWQADITPNIQLSNSNSRIYGIGDITKIYAPTELGGAGLVLTTNSAGKGLEWKNIPTTNVELNTQSNKLTIGDKTISFTGENGISVNSNSTNTITVRSLYSYNEDDFEIKNNTISLKNPQEQITLSAGDGITIDKSEISVKLDPSNESSYLTVGENGLKLSGIESAVSKQISESINKLSGSKKGDGTHVDVTVTQEGGNITGVTVAENNIASATDLANEIRVRKAADTALDSKIDTLETNVDSMYRAYPHIINEIYGDGTTNDWNLDKDSRIDILANNTLAVLKEIWGENHNYDWSKSSRIDNLESTVKLSFEDEINYGNNIFNFGLIFENISLATHNNAIVAGTNLGKIYLPTTGKCKICFKVLGAENTQILIGNHIKDVLLGSNDTVVKYTEYIIYDNLSKPYLNIKSTNGKIFIKDLSIQFENYNNITQQKIIKTVDTYTSTCTINELDSGFMPELGYNTYTDLRTVNITEPGFYKLTYEILASRDSCIAALMYYTPDLEDTPFKVDDYSWVTKPDYGLDSSGTINWYVNMDWYKADCMKAYPFKSNTNKTCLILYYVPYIHSYGCILYLRVYGDQNYLNTTFKINDFHLDKVVLNTETINNGTINNSVINNPNLILSSGTSKLFSGINDAGNVCLKYTLGGILKWTLDENGITMSNSDIPAEPVAGTVFYYSLNKPGINTPLSNLGKRILNVLDIDTSTTNGYYIDPINIQLGLDYEVHRCYVVSNGTYSIINIYVKNGYIIHDPNLVV